MGTHVKGKGIDCEDTCLCGRAAGVKKGDGGAIELSTTAQSIPPLSTIKVDVSHDKSSVGPQLHNYCEKYGSAAGSPYVIHGIKVLGYFSSLTSNFINQIKIRF